jgi:rRNA-processing protein FCF1
MEGCHKQESWKQMEVDRSRNDKVSCAVLDTNILMYILLYKLDVFSQLRELGIKRFIIPSLVVEELKMLEKSKGKERQAAKFALKVISQQKCEVVDVKANGADEALIATAKKHGCYLITNDKILRKKAKSIGIPIGYIREMRSVEITEINY